MIEIQGRFIPSEPDEFSMDWVKKLSLSNSVVFNFLTAYHKGWLTFEQALIAIITHLVIHNDELTELNIKAIQNQPRSVWTGKDIR